MAKRERDRYESDESSGVRTTPRRSDGERSQEEAGGSRERREGERFESEPGAGRQHRDYSGRGRQSGERFRPEPGREEWHPGEGYGSEGWYGREGMGGERRSGRESGGFKAPEWSGRRREGGSGGYGREGSPSGYGREGGGYGREWNPGASRGEWGSSHGREEPEPWYAREGRGVGYEGGSQWGREPWGGHMGPGRQSGSAGPRGFEREYGSEGARGDLSGPHAGRGPKGYQRSDERINEDICERLTQHPAIDATDIECQVQHGEVTLTGTVDDRQAKRMTEDVVEDVSGVKEVHNQLRVKGQGGFGAAGQSSQRAGKESSERTAKS